MRHVLVRRTGYLPMRPQHITKRLDAVELLNRARANEVRIRLPAPCLTEARPPIMRKCQPRNEADAIRQFLLRTKAEQTVLPDQERAAREVLDRSAQRVRGELRQLDDVLKSIRTEPGLDLFPLKEHMLERAIDLGTGGATRNNS